VLSVDWFIGMARALGNLIGNCVATVVVAAWEGDLDRDKAGARRRGTGRRHRRLKPARAIRRARARRVNPVRKFVMQICSNLRPAGP